MAGPHILTWNPSIDLSSFSRDLDTVPVRGIQTSATYSIVPQVTVEEDGEDDLMITEHPVQQGAVIADHAFKRPATVRVRMGWSNAYLFDRDQDVQAIYDEILRLQASRLPCRVYTGKRVYTNMLIASLRAHTDQKLEFTFMADIEFREVVLVNTSINQAGVAGYNKGALAKEDHNAPTLEAGALSPEPATLTPVQQESMGGAVGGET